MSDDGQIVVGDAINPVTGFAEPYRWSEVEGLQLLGLPAGEVADGPTHAADVSGDGSAIVGGTLVGSRFRAFLWTEPDGFTTLSSQDSTATGVSHDGAVVVGEVNAEAFRWSSTHGLQSLGSLSGVGGTSEAIAVSSDGLHVVGSSSSPGGHQAFRWSESMGMAGIGFLPGHGNQSVATAVSGSGQAVVGLSGVSGPMFGPRAFLWTEELGIEDLQSVLETRFDLASQLTGWTLTMALDISANGRFIVGRGINPAGDSEGWLVRLDQPIFVPEPAAVVLLLVLSLGMGQRSPRA